MYILYKYQAGKKVFMSASSGKWIKTARNAWGMSKEEAFAEAAKIGCCVQQYRFRD